MNGRKLYTMPRIMAAGVLMRSLVRQMQHGQDAVDDTVFLKKCLPCHGAQQEVHPHRKDEDKYNKAALAELPLPRRIMASG